MDLARELSALAAHVEWPPTPELRYELEPSAARRRRRRPLALGLALVVLAALVAALAVPQSRGAILRFFHLGAVTIVRVDKLPAAQERPLSAGIGPVVSLDEAKRLFRRTLLVPPLDPIPPAYLSNGSAVSFVFTYLGTPVLLSEFPFGGGVLKKFTGGATAVEGAGFAGSPGLWGSGAVHDVFFPGSSPRLAGNVLLWERHGATYRLESRSLTKAEAISLARSLTGG
ncbi:MAG TPA: hypothetical protein VF327_02135 [Gaiellaceae bacterium]